MLPCPSCKKEIDVNANPCPNCGRPEPFNGYMDKKSKQKEETERERREWKKDEVLSKEYKKLESRLGVGNWKQESKEEREQRKNERRIENSKNLKRGLIAGVLVMIYYFFRKFWMNL